MSHLIASKIVINDLDILKKAVAGFGGLTWNEGQKKFRWYAGREGAGDFGQCEHSISISGCDYQIGVVKRPDGEGWNLVFDPFDNKAAAKVGHSCEKVTAAYSEAYTLDFAAKHGFMIEESTDDEGNKVITMIDNS